MSDERLHEHREPSDVEALTAILAERAWEEARGTEEEPGADELFEFLEGTLPPEAERALERRLLASPEATRELLDLAEMREAEVAAAGAGDEAPAELAIHAGWRDLERRLPGRGTRTGPSWPWLPALAAVLFLAVVGLGVRVSQLERAAAPTAGASPLVSLELTPALRSGSEPRVEVPPGAALRLVLAPAERCDSYRAEISGPGGTHRIEGLLRDELGRVELLLHAEPGSYALLLEGCSPARELARREFTVGRPGAGTG